MEVSWFDVVPGRTLTSGDMGWHCSLDRALPELWSLLVGAGTTGAEVCSWSVGCEGLVVGYALVSYTTVGR